MNTTYGYDSLSRLLNVLHQAGTVTLDGAGYTYDNAGNRTAKTNYLNNITEQYTYDPTLSAHASDPGGYDHRELFL